MRRYDIVTGILLILSIIDFALAAPVPGREKHQALVDVVHMPKDVRTVLGKRWEEELVNLGEKYFKTTGKSIDSSGTYSSPSTAPSGPDHGSTVVAQPPAPNIKSSAATGNPDPMESPCSQLCSSSTTSMQGLSARGPGSCLNCLRWYEEGLRAELGPLHGHRISEAVTRLLTPSPNSRPLMNPWVQSDFHNLAYLMDAELPEHLSPLDSPPSTPLSTPSSPKEDSGEGSSSRGAWTSPPEEEPGVVFTPPSIIRIDPLYQSSSAASSSQPVDPLAAITAMKGKMKESR